MLNLVPSKHEDDDSLFSRRFTIRAHAVLQAHFVFTPPSSTGLYTLAERKPYFSQPPLRKIRCSMGVKSIDRESRELDSPRPNNRSDNCHFNRVFFVCVMTHFRVWPVPIGLQNLKYQIQKLLYEERRPTRCNN